MHRANDLEVPRWSRKIFSYASRVGYFEAMPDFANVRLTTVMGGFVLGLGEWYSVNSVAAICCHQEGRPLWIQRSFDEVLARWRIVFESPGFIPVSILDMRLWELREARVHDFFKKIHANFGRRWAWSWNTFLDAMLKPAFKCAVMHFM